MADTKGTKPTPEVSSDATPDKGVDTKSDLDRHEAQRQRNNDLVQTPPFEGDKQALIASGVSKQLVEGNDPDAALIA